MSNDDVVREAISIMQDYGNGADGLNAVGQREALAQALADAGLLARPLPTREEIADVILAESLFGSRTPIAAADAVLALLKGQDR